MKIDNAAKLLNQKLLSIVRDFVSVGIVQSETEKYIIVFTSNPQSKKLDFLRNGNWYEFPVQIKKMNQPRLFVHS